MNRRWLAAAAAASVLATAACGQRPGVSLQPVRGEPAALGLPPGTTVDPATGQLLDARGNVIGDLSSLGAPSGGSTPPRSGEGTSTMNASSAQGSSAGTGPPQGGDATGVTDTTIKIGAHAPLTGAAPIPSDSAEKGVALYWKWLNEINQDINGRDVEVILRNDSYNPSTAVAVCKEMIEKDKVFMLYGFAGTDQIQACARYSASVGVPYVSVGVTEAGLSGFTNYFAVTLTYPEQGELLADYLTNQLAAKKEKNGMLWFDTPNFQDAHDAFVQAMKKRGSSLSYDRGVSKAASTSEAHAVVQEMKTAGIENVYVLTSPVWFLQVLQAARSQEYEPQWVGVGITKALDTVASVGCRNGTLNRAKFFSPFPAWADINRYDPEFQRAVQAVYPDKDDGDDIMVIGWGMAKALAPLLSKPGRDLTRERFVYFAERAHDIRTGVYPPVTFSPTDHYGGTQVHVNEAQCTGYKKGDNRWHTIQSFVSDF